MHKAQRPVYIQEQDTILSYPEGWSTQARGVFKAPANNLFGIA